MNLDTRLWDVVVVGAGPAGAMAAYELGRRGCSVLLVERQDFPRWKVCGACLSGAAQRALAHAGLSELASDAGAPRLNELRLAGWGRSASVSLEGTVALSREALDDALVRAAVANGVVFVHGVSAEVGSVSEGARTLTLRGKSRVETVRARVVVSAAGLQGLRSHAAAGPMPVAEVQAGSRVGVGAVYEGGSTGGSGYGPGAIHMVVGPAGYVGLVRQEDHRLNVAAALDAEFLRGHGSPGVAVGAHLESAGMPRLPERIRHGWKGTPSLTRRVAELGGERLFLVGDAGGYVEPFTGEGMGWALWGALALAPLAHAGVVWWDDALVRRWTRVHHGRIGRRQRICRMVAWGLQRPSITRVALRTLAAVPALARPLVMHTSAIPRLQEGGTP